MPRKVDPKWGDDRVYTHETDIDIDLAAFKKLTSLSNFTDWSRLERELQDLSRRYAGWKYQNKNGPSRAEARAALEQLRATSDYSGTMFSLLNSRAQTALLDALATVAPRKAEEETNFSRILSGKLEKSIIDQAIDAAIIKLKEQTGPDPDHDFELLVQLLCEVFTNITGQTPTYFLDPADEKLASEAGVFIVNAMKQIDPTVPSSRIKTALRGWVQRQKIQ